MNLKSGLSHCAIFILPNTLCLKGSVSEGKERWRKKENNWELEQLYEQKIIRYAGEYYVIQGRYSHITGRGKVNTRKHGGLSIMECMTPVLNVRKK